MWYQQMSASYGALYDNLMGLKGVSKRAAFVIDRGGVVRHAQVLEKASDLPDFDVLEVVRVEFGPRFARETLSPVLLWRNANSPHGSFREQSEATRWAWSSVDGACAARGKLG